MRLKQTYGAREVAALTGLTARQLQWWDASHLLSPAIASSRTEAGGFTERRYSPVDLLELLVLADLRRHGFTVQKLRLLLNSLRRHFGVRIFEAIGGRGSVTLLTDGQEVYARTAKGEFFNLLRAPTQPLLEIGERSNLRELKGRARRRKLRKGRSSKQAVEPR